MSILSNIFARQVEMYEFIHKNTTYYYTNSDTEVLFLSHVFKPSPIKRGSIASTTSSAKSILTLTVARDFEIAKLFNSFNPSQIVCKVYRASRNDLNDYNKIFEGLVTTCTFNKITANLDVRPYSQHTSRQICRYAYSTYCNHNIYDEECGLNIADWGVNTTVVSINSDGVTVNLVDTGSNPEQYFKNGTLQAPNGDMRQIIDHVGNQVILKSPMPLSTLDTDFAVQVAPGCSNVSSLCESRFNNFENFSGFENAPDRNIYTDGV